MDPIQGSIVIPAIQVVMHLAAGWKVFGNISPLTAGSEQLHDSNQDFSDIDRAFVPTRLGRWGQRSQLGPLLVRQAMSVAQAATIVSETSFVGPHGAPRELEPCIELHEIRAGQAPLANRL